MKVQEKDRQLKSWATLKPAFTEDGKIHAGNSSQMSDGAAAILLMSREKAESLGLKPRFRVLPEQWLDQIPL